MNYKDLIGKTVFDFCNDAEILAKVTGFSDSLESKEYVKGFTPLCQAQLLSKLAEEINNKELGKAAEELEKELWAEWNKDCDEANKKGYIID